MLGTLVSEKEQRLREQLLISGVAVRPLVITPKAREQLLTPHPNPNLYPNPYPNASPSPSPNP